MQQRYYDPIAGRFLSVDPVVTSLSTGALFNRYEYAHSNPFKFIDPDGRTPDCTGSRVGCGLIYNTMSSVQIAIQDATQAINEWISSSIAAAKNESFSEGINRLLAGVPAAGAVRLAAAKGALPSTGGAIRQFEQQGAKTFYRVYSGEATTGGWLTSVPPKSSAWAQEALALPPWNKATHIQEVLVPNGTLLERSRAIPVPEWGRMRGGAEQFKLLEAIPDANFGPGRLLP